MKYGVEVMLVVVEVEDLKKEGVKDKKKNG